VLYNALWLPDGRSIIFSAASQPPDGNFDYNVYRLDIPSGAIEQLTYLTGLLDGLSVSTDGKKAVLLHQDVYSILDLGTHQLRPVRLQKPT
jgi:Tol biopolymer transport system component